MSDNVNMLILKYHLP